MPTHESGALSSVAPLQATELILVVSVDTDASGVAGDVLGTTGVAAFSNVAELTEILERAAGGH